MTNRFLFALIVLFSFAEATPPARAFPVAAPRLDMQSTDTSGAFILACRGPRRRRLRERSTTQQHSLRQMRCTVEGA